MLKLILYIFLGLLASLLIFGVGFVNLSPTFGGKPTSTQRDRYQQSPQYEEGGFVNQIPTTMDLDAAAYPKLLVEYIRGTANSEPEAPLPIVPISPEDVGQPLAESDQIYWLGHSAVILKTGNKTILLDPMMGPSPAPHPWLGGKRYSPLPIQPGQLPHIDIVLISHDHYDHLDYSSIRQLKDKTDYFYVPLGVGAHLAAWGVASDKIKELDWGDTAQVGNVSLVCTPARHFSGRALRDRNHTLWCSWVVQTPNNKFYFSGDSGYGPHFKNIGEQHGPFDFAMIECGQYDPRWEAIHMFPEQSVQAAIDLNTEAMMPIHWGGFTLSLHSWTDPVQRATAEAEELQVRIATPKIGEPLFLGASALPTQSWWHGLQ